MEIPQSGSIIFYHDNSLSAPGSERTASTEAEGVDSATSTLNSLEADSSYNCSYFSYAQAFICSLFSSIWTWLTSFFSAENTLPTTASDTPPVLPIVTATPPEARTVVEGLCDLGTLSVALMKKNIENHQLYKFGKSWILKRVVEENYTPFLGKETKVVILMQLNSEVVACSWDVIVRSALGGVRNVTLQALAEVVKDKNFDDCTDFCVQVLCMQNRGLEGWRYFSSTDNMVNYDAMKKKYPETHPENKSGINESGEERGNENIPLERAQSLIQNLFLMPTDEDEELKTKLNRFFFEEQSPPVQQSTQP